MGKPERKDRERLCSSSSYFLRCFGISLKIHSDKPTVDASQEKKKNNKKTKSRWFSRGTRLHLEDGEITTTTTYETEKQNLTVENDKQNLFRVIPHIAAVGQETKEDNTTEQKDINLDPLSFSGYDDKCHQQASTTLCGGKVESTKTVGSGSKRKELRREKSSRVRKVSRVDPVVGISIIMLTLMIMLTWGRLCAILCTSTWCFFLPLLKDAVTAAKRNRSGGGKAEGGLFPDDLDLNSEAYKKKVVMEGFLVRQRRVLY